MDEIKKEIREILENATVYENSVKLNCGKISRELYLEINEILERIGGSWKGGKTGKHIYQYNTADAISAILETNIFPQKNPFAFFPTPKILAEEMVKNIDIPLDNALILEPSAGQGNICDAIKKRWEHYGKKCSIEICELDLINKKILENNGYKIVGNNFLEYKPEYKYDFVFMNPPFSVIGDANAYITHIYHAFLMLKEKGELIAITNGGWEIKTQKAYRKFRDWIADKLVSYNYIEENTFETTHIATRMIHLTQPENNWRSKKHYGWGTHRIWDFILTSETNTETNKILYENYLDDDLPIEKIEEKIRHYFAKNERYYLPVTEKDLEEIKEYVIDIKKNNK